MNELSPRARALFERAKGFGGPSAADAARVHAAVIGTVATTAAGATVGGAAATGLIKMVLVFAVSASVASGTVLIARQVSSQKRAAPQVIVALPVKAEEPPPPEPQPRVDEVPAPEPALSPPPPAAPRKTPPKPGPEPVAEAPTPAPVPAPAPPPASAPRPACDISHELAGVERAQQQLDASPAEALSTLERLDRQCVQGDLVPERRAVRALALCALGRREEGLRERRWLEEHQPESPALARVRQACSEP